VSPFSHAIVRPPASTFANGLTMAELGVPDLELALEQHARYCEALVELGCELTVLPPDPAFPDSTFVEDTAVLTPRCAVIARPGAPSRAGEVAAIGTVLEELFGRVERIEPPGTLDGGDVCAAGEQVFIGVSERTNEAGARQLARILAADGFACSTVDIRAFPWLLHLKGGLAWLGGRDLAVVEVLAAEPAVRGWRLLRVPESEELAANCVRVNERVLVPAGFPGTVELLERAGHRTLALDMSEFEKQDGGLSCLSLRF
jgi:dimethylargininase